MWAERVSGRRWLALAAGVLVLGLGAVGCRPAEATRPSQPTGYPYRVVTTVGMVTDIVQQVAGERATVRGIIGAGVDPHLYKPTRNDVAALLDADIVFYGGLKLEGRMGDALARLARSGRPVQAVTAALPPEYLMDDEDNGHADPHVWMDVSAWRAAVGVVADTLSGFDPAGRDVYAANAARYQAELGALDAYVRGVIASIPAERRILLTAHDAFRYFGRAYDLEVRGIQGFSTESEAGLQDINALVDLLVARRIGAVFVESSVADRNVRALLEGAAARGHRVRIGGELYSDAMGPPRTYTGTYIGMIDHNATLIARALGGDAPPRGLHGRLTEAGE